MADCLIVDSWFSGVFDDVFFDFEEEEERLCSSNPLVLLLLFRTLFIDWRIPKEASLCLSRDLEGKVGMHCWDWLNDAPVWSISVCFGEGRIGSGCFFFLLLTEAAEGAGSELVGNESE